MGIEYDFSTIKIEQQTNSQMENNQWNGCSYVAKIQTVRGRTGSIIREQGIGNWEHRRFASQLVPSGNDDTQLSCRQVGKSAFKKKQLRDQSVKIIKSGLKIRSISSFNNLSSPLCQQQLNKNKNIGLKDPQGSQTIFKFSQVQSPTLYQGLDWTNKQKKKTRRMTSLVDHEKTIQSTVDQKRNENQRPLTKGIQFKRGLNRTLKKSSKEENNYILPFDVIKDQTFRKFKKCDFEIGKKLGSGNFCTAYLARHKKTGFICALKIMSKQRIRDQKYEGQITRQITIQSFLKHHNIVQLYGVFQDGENVYLLIQYCSDGHLFNEIRKNTRLSEERASPIVKGVSEAIQYIHRLAIIHRDLKPQNIFLNFGLPKVGDFGWAVYQGDGLLRRTVSGSPLYYSPQIVQKDDYDQKVDIWGIGTIAFECLVGMAPFKVYSMMNLNRIVQDELNFPSYVQISKESINFIERCLKKRPQERWSIESLLRHPFIRRKNE